MRKELSKAIATLMYTIEGITSSNWPGSTRELLRIAKNELRNSSGQLLEQIWRQCLVKPRFYRREGHDSLIFSVSIAGTVCSVAMSRWRHSQI